MPQVATTPGEDLLFAHAASWKELAVQDLVAPGEQGAQSCVRVQVPDTDQHKNVENILLRIKFLETFGSARYVCIYGLSVLVYH